MQIAQSFLQKPQVSNESFRSASLQDKSNYYIINDSDGEGFALISAHSNLSPLIAYSPTSQIAGQGEDELPEGLRYFLSAYDDYVKTKQEELRATNERYRRDFRYPSPIVAPLLDCHWGQYAPYYNECPKINGQLPPAGCVATAVGQIMYKHKHPTNPTGSHSYTLKATGQKLSRDFSLSQYDWSLLRPVYQDENDKSEGAKSIARLIADIGISVNMIYELNGSGALTRNASNALERYFDYQTKVIEAKELEQEEFLQYIKAELDNNFPIYMEGTSSQGGAHAWVVDGYDSAGLLHINWGWSGMSDGYFDLRMLNPTKKGAEFSAGVSGGFNREVAILVIHPNKKGVTPIKSLKPALGLDLDACFKPLTKKRNDIFTTSESLNVRLNRIYNRTKISFQARCGIGLFNSKGKKLKLFKPSEAHLYQRLYQANTTNSWELDFACELKDLTEGAYELRPIVQVINDDNSKEDWTELKGSRAIKLKVLPKTKVQILDYTDDKVHLISLRQPEEMAISKLGQKGRISLRLENTSYSKAWGKLKMLFYKQNPQTKKAEGNALEELTLAELRLKPLEVFDGDVVYQSKLPAGKYVVKFQLKEENNLYKSLEIEGKNSLALELYDASHRAWLQLTSLLCYKNNLIFESDVIDLDKDLELALGFRIKNVSEVHTFNGKVTFAFMNMENDELCPLFELNSIIHPTKEFANFHSKALFSPKEKGLKKGHTYRLVLKFQGKNDEQAIDLWTAEVARRYFTILGETEESPKDEEEKPKKEDEQKPKDEEQEEEQKPANLDNLEDRTLKVFPIPFDKQLNLQGLNPYGLLRIYDLSGRLMLQKVLLSEGELSLNLGAFPKGTYLLVLKARKGNKQEVLRLIK